MAVRVNRANPAVLDGAAVEVCGGRRRRVRHAAEGGLGERPGLAEAVVGRLVEPGVERGRPSACPTAKPAAARPTAFSTVLRPRTSRDDLQAEIKALSDVDKMLGTFAPGAARGSALFRAAAGGCGHPGRGDRVRRHADEEAPFDDGQREGGGVRANASSTPRFFRIRFQPNLPCSSATIIVTCRCGAASSGCSAQ